MRIIKFRGKTIKTGEWVYGYLNVNSKGETFISNEFSYWIVDPKTVGQFIGLPDKNKVEIYEGDIAQRVYEEKRFAPFEIEWGIIYGEELGEPQAFGYDLYDTENNLEIIGNIYDNPELLK